MNAETQTKVLGYTEQSDENKKLANELKQIEEQYMRVIDAMSKIASFDQRCVSEARTCIQTGNMWAVRAIFQPQRISLPGDNAHP